MQASSHMSRPYLVILCRSPIFMLYVFKLFSPCASLAIALQPFLSPSGQVLVFNMANNTSDGTNSKRLQRDWIFVGISGVTNGGKTQLTEYLMHRFPGSVMINQDTFFWPEHDPNHVMVAEVNHANWEAVSSIDWDRLLDAINTMTSQPPKDEPFFFVEGHIIFNHPKLVQLFRRKYFFTLTEEECYSRRRYRTYDPPDPPGYYDVVVWPMYLKNKEEMERSVKDVIYLDGAANQEETHKAVGDELQKLLVEF